MATRNLDFTQIIASTPRSVPAKVRLGALVLVVVGLLAGGYGMVSDANRTFTAFVFNFMYFMGIAQGAFMLCVAMSITKARWGRPLKRFGEALFLFTPVLYVLLAAFFLLGGLDIYEWTEWHEPGFTEFVPHHKELYLTKPFFIARMLGGLAVLIGLSFLYLRSSLRADLGVAAEALGDKAPAWWGKFTGGWKGAEAEAEAQANFQMRIAPLIAIVYAIVFSFMAVDMSMSLAPHWFANMFPAWYFMSCFWSGLVWMGIISLISRNWLGIAHLLTGNIYHDLGKLTFGFTMFWGYTTFAQYLPIWYGNMTEEIGFVLLRTTVEPWATMSKIVVMCCFLVPFTMLLSRGLKKIPPAYLSVTGIIAVGIWLERYTVVVPSVWKHDTLPLGFIEIGIGLGLLGAMIMVATTYLSKVPPVPINDPFMKPHPDEVHVHPSGAH